MTGKSLKNRLRRVISFSLFLFFYSILLSPCKSATIKESSSPTYDLNDYTEVGLKLFNDLEGVLISANDLQILIRSTVNSNVYNRNFYYSLINNDNKDQEIKENTNTIITARIRNIMNYLPSYLGIKREIFFQGLGTTILLNKKILEKNDLKNLDNFLNSYVYKACSNYYNKYKFLEEKKGSLVKNLPKESLYNTSHSLKYKHDDSVSYRHYCYKEYKEEIQNGIVQQNNDQQNPLFKKMDELQGDPFANYR